MSYNITLPLPEGWTCEQDILTDEVSFEEISHLEAHLPNDKKQTDEAMIDIYVGPMPEDSTAADQAMANYADMIGFEDDEDEDPIIEWPFQGKVKAYGFEGLCEDESPLRVMCAEPAKGALMIATIIGRNDAKLEETVTLVAKNLKIQ